MTLKIRKLIFGCYYVFLFSRILFLTYNLIMLEEVSGHVFLSTELKTL